MNNNLLIRLSRWAKKHNENFTTEAFIHLFTYLRDHEPNMACGLVSVITHGQLDLNEEQAKNLTFETQVTHKEGKPDIEITAPNTLILIEVKVTANLGINQLKQYRLVLKGERSNKKLLILVSKNLHSNDADVSIHWNQITKWLRSQLNDGKIREDVSKYVVKQFADFLEADDLAAIKAKKVSKVSLVTQFAHVWKTVNSGRIASQDLTELYRFPHLRDLLIMMGDFIGQTTSVLVAGLQVDRSKWVGYAIENGKYYFYMQRHSEGYKLVFTTWNCSIDLQQAKGFGQLIDQDGPKRWINELDLSSTRFFSPRITPEEQKVIVGDFYVKSFNFAKRITIQKVR